MLVDLDALPSLDPVRVGGKAAALAAARAAGLPVLPGFVVEGAASMGHLRLGAKTLPERGSGGARLVVSREPIDLADDLVSAGQKLGARLVARSSMLLESSGEWAGAFTSYTDIGPQDLPKAVAGCWASAFSVAALQRQEAADLEPGSFPISVLVQPALEPAAGGWARLGADGVVEVHGIRGTPAPLLQGWERGQAARYQGAWSGDELVELLGLPRLEAIRELLAGAHAATGANRIEWASAGRVWALQLTRATDSPAWGPPSPDVDASPELLELVRVVVLAPGALGNEMVLPWALAGLPEVDVPTLSSVQAPIDRARELVRELTEEVWGLPWARAGPAAHRMMGELRGADPVSALDRVRHMRPPDPEKAVRLLAILRFLRRGMVERGVAADQHTAWFLGLDAIAAAFEGRPVSVSGRLGIRPWEPLVAAVVLSCEKTHRGTPASPGVGAGRRVDVADPYERRSDRRGVVSAAYPTPNLAGVLWDAAGLVTSAGSPAAHLFEAARALRVPAVCGHDLGEPADDVVAVDGHNGLVATMSIGREL